MKDIGGWTIGVNCYVGVRIDLVSIDNLCFDIHIISTNAEFEKTVVIA